MYSTDEKKTARRRSRKRGPADTASEANAGDWARRRLEFSPDAVQEHVLTTPSRRLVMNCTRQWGKSTVTAAKAVHQALHSGGEPDTGSESKRAADAGSFCARRRDFCAG